MQDQTDGAGPAMTDAEQAAQQVIAQGPPGRENLDAKMVDPARAAVAEAETIQIEARFLPVLNTGILERLRALISALPDYEREVVSARNAYERTMQQRAEVERDALALAEYLDTHAPQQDGSSYREVVMETLQQT